MKLPRCPVCGRAMRSWWMCCNPVAAETDRLMEEWRAQRELNELMIAWKAAMKENRRRKRA